MQQAKELTLSVLEDVSRRKFDERGPNTPARGAEGTAADLQATASAADLSSPRCFDDKMLEPAAPIETFARFQAGFLSSEDFHRFLSIISDFHGFS